MLSVIPLPVLVCLGPHGHSAVGTADKSFEEILPGWTGVQGLRPATVTFQRCLDQIKEFLADQGFVGTRKQFPTVLYLACVEGIMKDNPD